MLTNPFVADGVQFFLLPLVLGTSLLSLGVSNTLFAVAFGWYFYITHLGYRGKKIIAICCFFSNLICSSHSLSYYNFAMDTYVIIKIAALPFLSNTEVFLFPIAAILAIYVFNLMGYPFSLGFNASRIVAYIYFES